MDEYEREDRAVATVREWLTSTYGTQHYATEQAMNSKHNVLPALFTATIDEPSRRLDVFWCGALVDRHLLLVVDGGRAVLPNFHRGSINTGQLDSEDVGKTATASEVRVARLAHCLGNNIGSFEEDHGFGESFDHYFERARIVEVPDDAPA
jgi:hypothetical protein